MCVAHSHPEAPKLFLDNLSLACEAYNIVVGVCVCATPNNKVRQLRVVQVWHVVCVCDELWAHRVGSSET